MTFEVTPSVEVGTDGWQDVTEHVFSTGLESVTIQHGNQGMNQGLGEPSSCAFKFIHPDMWPDNPTSPHYGLLGLNTRMRVADTIFEHTFPGTVVNGWSTVGGFAVTNTGGDGGVAASDWQQTPGVGTHSVPGTSQFRKTVLEDYEQEDGEQAISFRLPTSNVTGGGIEPANLICQWQSDNEYILLRLVVQPDESITMKFTDTGSVDLTDEFTCSNVVNSGQWIRVKTNVETRRLQAKAWSEDTDVEPVGWTVDAATDATQLSFSRRGGIGVRTGVAAGNTNASPRVVEYRNWTARAIMFFGGISEFPLEPVYGSDGEIEIPIVANGKSRQYSQGQLPAVSALGRSIPTQPGLVEYWPMEDEEDAGSFASGLPGHQPLTPIHGMPGFAEYSALDCSLPLPNSNLSDWAGPALAYTDTGFVQLVFILRCPSSPLPDLSILLRFYIEHPTAKFWQLVYNTSSGGSLRLQAWTSESDVVYNTGTGIDALDDSVRLVSLELTNNGGNVDWDIVEYPIDDLTVPGSSDSGTAAGLQVSTVKRPWVNVSLRDDVTFGHLMVFNQAIDIVDLALLTLAFKGDTERARLGRVYGDNNIEFTAEDEPFGVFFEYRMGPQTPKNMTTLLEEAVDLNSGGIVYDGRSHDGMVWRDRFILYQPDPQLELTYDQLSEPFTARRDDRDVRNRITVKRDGGSSGTYELTSGRKSTLPPDEGGVGLYPSAVTVNKEDDDELQQIAAWRVAIGTVDEPRYSTAMIELAAIPAVAGATIRARLRDLRPGHLVTISDAEKIYAFDPIQQRVAGYKVTLTQFRLAYELNTLPLLPFRVFEVEDSERGRLDSDSSTLAAGINTVATQFQVDSPAAVWTTDPAMFPFKLTIGGERMVVNDITGTVPAMIAAGTASHADNTSCTPGVPGGATGAGDDMLMITRGRAQAANDPASWGGGSGAGWSTVITSGTIKVFRKTHSGSESAPTVTWAVGSAGDTNSAVTLSVADLGDLITSIGTSVGGGGQQNIPILGLTGVIPDGIAITVGVKNDDWTGVATRSSVGATEIVDVSTTVGNDQGMVIDYVTHNGSVTGAPSMTTAANEFVVTGGAAAPVRSLVMIFGNRHTFDVDRSDNNVVKSHDTGAPVHIYNPPRWAL
jgi:hypothetical protein